MALVAGEVVCFDAASFFPWVLPAIKKKQRSYAPVRDTIEKKKKVQNNLPAAGSFFAFFLSGGLSGLGFDFFTCGNISITSNAFF